MIETTLNERGHIYGDFTEQCRIGQGIKAEMSKSKNWHSLTPEKREALEMIATKIARILNGDPDHQDTWHDIGGYARLVETTLETGEN